MGKGKTLDISGPKLFKSSDVRKLLVSARSAKRIIIDEVEAGTSSSFR